MTASVSDTSLDSQLRMKRQEEEIWRAQRSGVWKTETIMARNARRSVRPAARRLKELGWPDSFEAKVSPPPIFHRKPIRLVQITGEPFYADLSQEYWQRAGAANYRRAVWLGSDKSLYTINLGLWNFPKPGMPSYSYLRPDFYRFHDPEEIYFALVEIMRK